MTTPSSELALHVGSSVVLGLVCVGFFVGMQREPWAPEPDPSAEAPQRYAPPALSYADKRSHPPGLGPVWDFEAARFVGPGLLDPVPAVGSKDLDLADRAAHRAYDGAPPTIPHAVGQGGAAECLACHDTGLQIRGRLAPPMSHELHSSCTQCHVVERSPVPGVSSPDVDNSFVGLASPIAGERAWSIAPPVIPHSTQNRERCMSCHGTNGRDALRTPHPDRSSCTQCHAPSAALDLRPGLNP